MTSTDANLYREPNNLMVEFQWSELPADLLRKISKRLHDICDFIYFRLVCKNWRALTTTSDSPHAQVPWLIYLPRDAKDSGFLCFRSFFYDDKIRNIHCPQLRGMHLQGLLHGYLYTQKHDFNKHSFINPLIKHEVALQFSKSDSRQLLLCTSSTLIEDSDYITFMDLHNLKLRFYQPHKSKRDFIKGPHCKTLWTYSYACLKGMYFTHDRYTGNTEMFDIARGFSFVIPPLQIPNDQENVFFVQSEENILKIVKNCKRNFHVEECDDELVTGVYRFDVDHKINQYRWIKTDDIGNQILFLNCWYNSSGISITARGSNELMKNCIYYLECYGMYKYDIKSGQTQQVVRFATNSFTSWFVPSLVAFPPSSRS